MKFKDIEVSGIETIVFNRTLVWKKMSDTMWACHAGNVVVDCPHDAMMRIVNAIKSENGARLWVHGYTLNVESPNIVGYEKVLSG